MHLRCQYCSVVQKSVRPEPVEGCTSPSTGSGRTGEGSLSEQYCLRCCTEQWRCLSGHFRPSSSPIAPLWAPQSGRNSQVKTAPEIHSPLHHAPMGQWAISVEEGPWAQSLPTAPNLAGGVTKREPVGQTLAGLRGLVEKSQYRRHRVGQARRATTGCSWRGPNERRCRRPAAVCR